MATILKQMIIILNFLHHISYFKAHYDDFDQVIFLHRLQTDRR